MNTSKPYVPAYMDPRFQQSLPKPADELTLLGERDTRKRATLLYEDPETKEQYLVPNCWHNQTLKVQISVQEYYLARVKEAIANTEREMKVKSGDSLLKYRLEDQQRRISDLESFIAGLMVKMSL